MKHTLMLLSIQDVGGGMRIAGRGRHLARSLMRMRLSWQNCPLENSQFGDEHIQPVGGQSGQCVYQNVDTIGSSGLAEFEGSRDRDKVLTRD